MQPNKLKKELFFNWNYKVNFFPKKWVPLQDEASTESPWRWEESEHGGCWQAKTWNLFLRMCGMGGSEKLGDESRAQGTQEECGLHSLVLPFPSCACAWIRSKPWGTSIFLTTKGVTDSLVAITGSLVVKTLCFQGRINEFNCWLGN